MRQTWIKVTPVIITLLAFALPGPTQAEQSHRIGADVSYPQCTRALPTSYDFLILGVNGGVATNANRCLQNELIWATDAQAHAITPPVFYANTGNPIDVTPTVADWPRSSNPLIDPYGLCRGNSSSACAWQFGYERAQADASAVTSRFWWLDIEPANSWAQNLQTNRAVLQGMVYAFTIAGAGVGVYSLPAWWNQIIGIAPKHSSLYGLPEWLPGAENKSEAITNCQQSTFTGAAHVALTQFTTDDHDYDVSCRDSF
jgi:hypothetical protein